MGTGLPPRRVAILVYPGVQSLDLTGPLEVFAGARRLIEAAARPEPTYEVQIVAARPDPLRCSSGLTITPDCTLPKGGPPIDTLLVAGGAGRRGLEDEAEILDWLAETSAGARRTASVCTGAFLLAAAGLLDGRRATTHWAYAAELQRRHPQVTVDPDPIYLRDGSIWTSAGVTAGMDLALALVEEDTDRELALTIARHLVLFLRRPGSQSQFSATLLAQQPARDPLREIQRLILEDVAGEHSVEALAARAHMSPRHLARTFRAETGVTPARYVERVRLEAARRRLEETVEPIGTVAQACGFGTAETMRRVFLRVLDVGPAEYRRRFRSSAGRPSAAASAELRASPPIKT
jgi:transcriptional regulator GlxA family with amidase domain